jgi:hypothetical protein
MVKLASNLLIVAGICLFVLGLLLRQGFRLKWLGKLPGDIIIQKSNVTFYFPLATSLLLSFLLSLILLLIFKLSGKP